MEVERLKELAVNLPPLEVMAERIREQQAEQHAWRSEMVARTFRLQTRNRLRLAGYDVIDDDETEDSCGA